MATVTIGGSNGIVWDGITKTKAQFAAASDNVTTDSSSVTLNACSFDNKDAASPTFTDSKGTGAFMGNKTISSNIQELTIDSNTEGGGLFGIGTVTVNSGVYVWSNSTSNPALKIALSDVSVVNNGYIIGKGGQGGRNTTAGTAGGPALEITSGSTGVTVTNNSGAYIAGGGGGGSGGRSSAQGVYCGGGGGAGGGGGGGYSWEWGGGLRGNQNNGGAVGSNGGGAGAHWGGQAGSGGGAGGGGGGTRTTSINGQGGGGGGGGRVLPGTGGYRGGTSYAGGNGGAAGNAGSSGGNQGGGGGGWGATGGAGRSTGGAGGPAIKDNGQSYTLSNSGTVYGTT